MRFRLTAAAAMLFLAGALPAVAGPQDTRVGETRVIFARAGTVIRAEGAATATPVATLPAGTQVLVQEVKLPWVKVQATPAGAAAPVVGWLRAFEAIEQSALSAAPKPAHVGGPVGGGTLERDAAAAGRQFTADTERGYRASQADVQAAYVHLDAIERETAEANPYDAINFIMDGDLGRRGRDYELPPRLAFDETSPESPQIEEERPSRGGGGGGFGGLPGGFGGLPGGLGGRLPGGLGNKFKLPGGLGKLGLDVGDLVDIAVKLAPLVRRHLFNTRRLKEADFTPTQEYYLGRAVAADAIAKYGLDPDVERRRYVKRIGDAMVRVAGNERIFTTVGGYHFDVLNSDEINGVSGPGGYVLITRGAVLAAQTEDEVAAVLAHELAHIAAGHWKAVLKASKSYRAQGDRTEDILKAATSEVLPADFQPALGSLFATGAREIAASAGNHAYASQFEYLADRDGTWLLYDVYYDWRAMQSYLSRMSVDPMAGRGGVDHPTPASRVQALAPVIQPYGAFDRPPAVLENRQARFRSTLGIRPSPK
jgi:beta-barrel assembly-enhancing protease